ncbi:histidine kinase [Caldovatus sediminis]|uniref:histidine kinase n=1 Tax=Caldovatus sediminis TaxID=2041189 RepID=A0A8J2Z8N6_9PROT|nr:PAS domain S-box protein [Caldovatus sediminis]GGG21449.1 histidine kinase [Caldovatus sediminis]
MQNKVIELKPAAADRRYRVLAEALTDLAICTLDPQGRIESWNPGAERLLGFSAAEAIGQPFTRVHAGERQAAAALAAAAESGRHETEGWRTRRDGSRFWAASVLVAARDEAGRVTGFAELTRDVSARREAELRLTDSERRFRILVEGVTDYAIFMLDTDGRVTNWNPGAERIKGYTAEEAVGTHFSRFYTPEDRAADRPTRALATAARTGRFETEGWRVRKDGSRFWASVVIDAIRDEEGRLIGFAKITRDVTETREAQRRLEESERHFRLLVQSVTDYAIFMLDLSGRVTSWNEGARRITGYAAGEIIGEHVSRFHTEEDRAAGMPARGLVLAAGEGRFEAEGWRVRKDGSRFWASVVIEPVRDEAGRLIGFAKVTRDISERREAQRALEEMREQLSQALRLEAVGQLTGGVAHDFNNLLQVIDGGLRLLERRFPKEAGKATEIIASMRQATARGASLTRQLLAFARRLPLRAEVVDTAARLREIAALAARSLRGDIRIETDIPDGLWPIEVDPAQFELALLNVAINARDAMPRGGVLRIAAENATLHAPGEGLEGDCVVIRVGDTGTGIPRELLGRVLEPFFTTKPPGKGTGLGLSQAFGFARQSGGALGIESEVGRGTTVTFRLPATKRSPVSRTQRDAAAAGPQDSGPAAPVRVLVVDDDPTVARLAAELLEGAGHRATAVPDARAALELLERSRGADFDLVFTDVLMPGGISGLDLARAIRARWPLLPVLLASGYAGSYAGAAARELPVVHKPYSEAELLRAVAKLSRGRG